MSVYRTIGPLVLLSFTRDFVVSVQRIFPFTPFIISVALPGPSILLSYTNVIEQ